MIPTVLTGLLVGVDTLKVVAIKALSAWIVGSSILGGNLFFDTTYNAEPAVYRDTVEMVTLTQSGVELLSLGIPVAKAWDTPCTNTGGLAKYPTCYVRNPFGATGSLVTVRLECGDTNKALSMSGGLVTSTTAAVSTAFPGMDDVSVGTGADIAFNIRATSGSTLKWKPGESIKFQTVTAMPAGGADCVVHTEAYQKYGR